MHAENQTASDSECDRQNQNRKLYCHFLLSPRLKVNSSLRHSAAEGQRAGRDLPLVVSLSEAAIETLETTRRKSPRATPAHGAPPPVHQKHPQPFLGVPPRAHVLPFPQSSHSTGSMRPNPIPPSP